MVQREDNKGRRTDNPGIHHPSRTNLWSHLHHPQLFTPDALPAATLPIYPDLDRHQVCRHAHPVAWFAYQASTETSCIANGAKQ